MKKIIIKIVSIVLVICTLITVFVIPASAYINVHTVDFNDLDLSNFIVFFPIDRFAIKKYNNSLGKVELLSYDHMSLKHYVVDGSADSTYMETMPVDTYLTHITWQSRQYTSFDYKEGDIITFSLSILAPPCDDMAFFIYFTDGTRTIVPFTRSSEKVWSNEMLLRDYCTGTKGYGGLQFCHRYSLNYQFESDGRDIQLVQIQQVFSAANKIQSSWIFYEDCKFNWDDSANRDTGTYTIFGKISNWISNLYSSTKEFFLSFGTKIKDAVQPLFNSIGNVFRTVGETLKSAFNTVGDGLKTAFSAVGNLIITPIKNLGEHLTDWFSNTFLGKVLRITSKTKEFIATAGNDVQYASLDDEGESTEEKGPDDWDMLHRPSFEIDIDYYSNLYPNLLTGG